jgi:hypothetical protein
LAHGTEKPFEDFEGERANMGAEMRHADVRVEEDTVWTASKLVQGKDSEEFEDVVADIVITVDE